MRRTIANCCVLVTLSATVACGQQPRSNRSAENFPAFWSQFREAALAGNGNRVAELTQFPFRTRGPTDSDPTVTHDRAAFDTVFQTLLGQDPGLRPEPETMRSLIDRTATVTSDQLGDGGQTARIGLFVFQKVGNRWLFTMAYTGGE